MVSNSSFQSLFDENEPATTSWKLSLLRIDLLNDCRNHLCDCKSEAGDARSNRRNRARAGVSCQKYCRRYDAIFLPWLRSRFSEIRQASWILCRYWNLPRFVEVHFFEKDR